MTKKSAHFIMTEKLKLSEDDLIAVTSDPLEVFRNSIRSPFTLKTYERHLKFFLCDILEDIFTGSYDERAKQLAKMGKTNHEKTSQILYAYVKRLKEQTELPVDHPKYLAIKTLKTRMKPIKKFFEMNDILFNWKRLNSIFPEDRDDYPDMRGYTKDEIRTMLKYATTPRDIAVILVAASSGIRVGAFDFKWEDIKPISRVNENLSVGNNILEKVDGKLECATIVVYKGSRDMYEAFITPEAFDALLEYRKLWAFEVKQEPVGSDFVFTKAGPHKELLGRISVTRKIQKIRMRSGLGKQLRTSKRRNDVPVMHGFRKFFNKAIKNTPSSYEFIGQYILRERMMGHSSLVELDKNYYEDSLLEKAEEYIKSVPYLTISEDQALKEENKKLKQEREKLEKRLPSMIEEAAKRINQELLKDGFTHKKQ